MFFVCFGYGICLVCWLFDFAGWFRVGLFVCFLLVGLSVSWLRLGLFVGRLVSWLYVGLFVGCLACWPFGCV